VVMDPLRSCGLLAISCLISRVLVPVDAGNLDRFTYRDDATGQDGEYGPVSTYGYPSVALPVRIFLECLLILSFWWLCFFSLIGTTFNARILMSVWVGQVSTEIR